MKLVVMEVVKPGNRAAFDPAAVVNIRDCHKSFKRLYGSSYKRHVDQS